MVLSTNSKSSDRGGDKERDVSHDPGCPLFGQMALSEFSLNLDFGVHTIRAFQLLPLLQHVLWPDYMVSFIHRFEFHGPQ